MQHYYHLTPYQKLLQPNLYCLSLSNFTHISRYCFHLLTGMFQPNYYCVLSLVLCNTEFNVLPYFLQSHHGLQSFQAETVMKLQSELMVELVAEFVVAESGVDVGIELQTELAIAEFEVALMVFEFEVVVELKLEFEVEVDNDFGLGPVVEIETDLDINNDFEFGLGAVTEFVVELDIVSVVEPELDNSVLEPDFGNCFEPEGLIDTRGEIDIEAEFDTAAGILTSIRCMVGTDIEICMGFDIEIEKKVEMNMCLEVCMNPRSDICYLFQDNSKCSQIGSQHE